MIIVVCTGNICRSPVAQQLLSAAINSEVKSAGLNAVVGSDIDESTKKVAATMGISLKPHCAAQFDSNMARNAYLILVMENHQRIEICEKWPVASGKTLLLGQFDGNIEVPDPYRRGDAMHASAIALIKECTSSWALKLRGTM